MNKEAVWCDERGGKGLMKMFMSGKKSREEIKDN